MSLDEVSDKATVKILATAFGVIVAALLGIVGYFGSSIDAHLSKQEDKLSDHTGQLAGIAEQVRGIAAQVTSESSALQAQQEELKAVQRAADKEQQRLDDMEKAIRPLGGVK